ncbi:MAG: LPS assembly lipoprotein LptE [Pirellulales bacterium]
MNRLLRIAVVGVVLATCTGGCTPYRFGVRSLYPPDIQTVYVPVFTSNSFRPALGERLTEAVAKEIELRTPYKVVGSPEADSILTGQLVRDTKRLTIESPTDEARETEIAFAVRVTWIDRNGGMIHEGNVPLPPASVDIMQTAFVHPEVGSSIATGQQEVIERLARQIVSLMEAPW